MPGKSTTVPRKTTPRQDRDLLRIVISAWDLTVRMRNLYGIRAGRKTINNQLFSHGCLAYRPTSCTRRPVLTANHRCLDLEWAQRWQNLTMAHWQHVIFSDESRLQLHSVDCRFRVRRDCFHQGCQAYRVQAGGGSVDVWRAFHSGANSHPVLPHRHFTSELYRGIL